MLSFLLSFCIISIIKFFFITKFKSKFVSKKKKIYIAVSLCLTLIEFFQNEVTGDDDYNEYRFVSTHI